MCEYLYELCVCVCVCERGGGEVEVKDREWKSACNNMFKIN